MFRAATAPAKNAVRSSPPGGEGPVGTEGAADAVPSKDLEKASFFKRNAEYGSCRGRHTFSLGIVCPAQQKKHKKNFPGSGGMDHGTI